MTDTTLAQQIAGAYKQMERVAHYRPQAPSDGLGNITVPLEELDLAAEALTYARRWWDEEDEGTFRVGCCNYPTRPAAIFAMEAVRCLNAAMDDVALSLLRMAVLEVEEHGNGGLPWHDPSN